MASGASALGFEALWFQQASLAFGSSLWASSLVLAGFMGGIAMGGGVAARRGAGFRDPLRVCAALEALIAVSGFALVPALPALGAWLAPRFGSLDGHVGLVNALRFALALALLLVPASAIGATLPMLSLALARLDANFTRLLGRLYGVNTLGAVVGVVATETLLVGTLGIRGTALVACAGNLVAAALALVLSARFRAQSPTAKDVTAPATERVGVDRHVIVAFGAGFALLGLEVVWLRLLLLFLDATSLAFAMILAVVLTGIALGGLLAAWWCGRTSEPERHLGSVAFAAGVLGVVGYRLFPWLGGPFLQSGGQSAASIVGLCLPLMLPTSLASGALYALLGGALQRRLGGAHSAATGRLGLANTLGAALGSLVSGFVLLPYLGMEKALLALFALYGVLGALLAWRGRPGRSVTLGGSLAFAAALALFPFGDVQARFLAFSAQKWMAPGDRVVAVREGVDATLMYVEHRVLGLPNSLQLLTNSYSMSTNAFAVRRYAKLYVYLPLCVRPAVKSALVIGFGAGNTASALTDSAELESIDVADLSRDILALSDVAYPDPKRHPLHDPRVQVHVEDGRYFLQGTAKRFDLITGEPPPHHLAGVGSLYSREYFRLLREHLADGGVVTYWLHMHLMTKPAAKAIVRAFCDAFEDCSLWQGSGANFMLVGTNGARGPVSEESFGRQWREPRAAAELTTLGFERAEQIGALFVGDAPYLKALVGDVPPAADDYPARVRFDPEADSSAALVDSWRDSRAARERFAASPLISALWPPALRERTQDYFETQALIDALIFDRSEASRTIETLDDLLLRHKLTLPALLVLKSDPDTQRAIAAIDPARSGEPDVVRHRAVGLVAARNWDAAMVELTKLRGTKFDGTAAKLYSHVREIASGTTSR